MRTLTAPTPAPAAKAAAAVRRNCPGASLGEIPLLAAAAAGRAGSGGPAPGSTTLSRRQQEILRAACEGVSDKVIAAELGVSPRTLEGHWRAIHHKLGTTNRCQAGFVFAALRDQSGA